MKNRTLAFVFTLTLLSLNGCASFIADKITSPRSVAELPSAFNQFTVKHSFCSNVDDTQCFIALEPAFYKELKTRSQGKVEQKGDNGVDDIRFTFHLNEDKFLWEYSLDKQKSTYTEADPKEIIYILPGYAVSPALLLLHSAWIRDVSGYRTFIMPPANGGEHFEFGLNYVAAIERHGRELKAEKIHIVASSMGAVAGTELHKRLNNSQLYLFAPMSDFRKGVHAVIEHTRKWYTGLIPHSSIDAAIEKILEQSQVDENAFDLVAKVKQSQGNSHIYLGSDDEVIDSKPWLDEPSLKEQVHVYDENHITLTAMLNMQLMADFSGHILGKPVSASDAHIVGVLSKNGEQIELAKGKKKAIN